jgi:hypothetical protein
MEWNGMEWNGMEWNGMEWNGMEWNGMEWNGYEAGSYIRKKGMFLLACKMEFGAVAPCYGKFHLSPAENIFTIPLIHIHYSRANGAANVANIRSGGVLKKAWKVVSCKL